MLTRSRAVQLFGKTDVIGKTVQIKVDTAIFAVTALLALGIAFFTIGVQAWRAARANPAKNMRIE